MKKMFVVVRVEDLPGHPGYVRPVEMQSFCNEVILKKHVIYADEMESRECHDKKWFSFFGVSPSLDPDDEWEQWMLAYPWQGNHTHNWETNFVAWLRKMPRKEKL